MKLHVKNDAAELYNSLDDCRPDKKGYGCVTKNGKTYYFDLVTISDVFASKMRYKKKGSTTTYAIGDSNLKDLSHWAKKTYPSTYKTITTLSSSDISYLNSVRGTDMSRMFTSCNALTTLNVSNWDTSHVTDMTYMFYECKNLNNINITNWNTKKVKFTYSMFCNCDQFTTINMSNFDVSSNLDLGAMFEYCDNLTSVGNISNWKFSTTNLVSMWGLFLGCTKLTTIGDLSKWDTSNFRRIDSMFAGCKAITSLDLSTWVISKNITRLDNVFRECINLEVLDLSNWDTRHISSVDEKDSGEYNGYGWGYNYDNSLFTSTGTFQGCSKLKYLIIGSPTFKFQMRDSHCADLNTTCKILVPNALINTFKTQYINGHNNYWYKRASQFDAIENYNITRSNGKVTVTHK